MENRAEELRALAAEHRHDGELAEVLGNTPEDKDKPSDQVATATEAAKPARRARRAKTSDQADEAASTKETNGAE